MSMDEDRMAALRQRFVAAANEHADRIEALLRRGDLEGVRQVAHGLAGRSGMFGFVELGETARCVDEAEGVSVARHAGELLKALRRLAQVG